MKRQNIAKNTCLEQTIRQLTSLTTPNTNSVTNVTKTSPHAGPHETAFCLILALLIEIWSLNLCWGIEDVNQHSCYCDIITVIMYFYYLDNNRLPWVHNNTARWANIVTLTEHIHSFILNLMANCYHMEAVSMWRLIP